MLGKYYCVVSSDMKITIPDELTTGGKIVPGCEVICIGAGDHIEIWEKSKWDEMADDIEDTDLIGLLNELDF